MKKVKGRIYLMKFRWSPDKKFGPHMVQSWIDYWKCLSRTSCVGFLSRKVRFSSG